MGERCCADLEIARFMAGKISTGILSIWNGQKQIEVR